jgi:hypothetical protein
MGIRLTRPAPVAYGGAPAAFPCEGQGGPLGGNLLAETPRKLFVPWQVGVSFSVRSKPNRFGRALVDAVYKRCSSTVDRYAGLV